jgi:hypothetical protein
MRRLARQLRVGRTWQRRADMRQIENVLAGARLGVRSVAGEEVTFRKIAARLARNQGRYIAIASLDGLHIAGAGRRYYVVLAGRTPAELYVAAMGMYTGAQSVKFMNQHLGEYLGRVCLFVGLRKAAGPGNPFYPPGLPSQLTTIAQVNTNCAQCQPDQLGG